MYIFNWFLFFCHTFDDLPRKDPNDNPKEELRPTDS